MLHNLKYSNYIILFDAFAMRLNWGHCIVSGMALFLLILKPFQSLNWSLNGYCSFLFRVLTLTGGETDQNKALNVSFRSTLPKHLNKVHTGDWPRRVMPVDVCAGKWRSARPKQTFWKEVGRIGNAATARMMRNMPLGSRAEHLKETVRQLRCDLESMMLRKKRSVESVWETDGGCLDVCEKESTHSSRGLCEVEEGEHCGEPPQWEEPNSRGAITPLTTSVLLQLPQRPKGFEV